MKKTAVMNETIQVLLAWEFVILKEGTEVNYIRENRDGTHRVEFKKGKHKGRQVDIFRRELLRF